MPAPRKKTASLKPAPEPVAMKHAAQAAFIARMEGGKQFLALFEHLPDVHFFVKDAEGRFVAGGGGLLKRLGFLLEEEIIGLSDADIHPPRTAREIREDDLRVMETRKPLINRVETLFTRSQAKDWYMTTKLPIFDTQGAVIGVMGFVRPYRREGSADRLEATVAHVRAHHAEALTIPALAKVAHLSARQLNRRFQEVFGMSAQEFIVRTRVQAASDDLILTDKPLSEITHDHGFYDQSAFSRQFHQHTGETPLKFRQRQQQSSSAA